MIRGLLRLALAILAGFAPTLAHAGCTSANQYNFAFASQAAATLAYGSSYNYTATTSGGASQAFTMAVSQNGLSSTSAGGQQLPAISTLITGPDTSKRDLVVGGTFSARTTDLSSGTRAITVTFTFATPVRDFAMTVHDVDYTLAQYRDWLQISGVGNGVTYTPSLTTPWGNNNAANGARTATNSSVTMGPTSATLTLSAMQAAGSGASTNGSDTGTVTATFAQPVTSITLRYGNYPALAGDTAIGQQGLGVQGISFCPMPNVTVRKTSAPASGTLGAYNLPGSDVVYSLTVTNAGGSPVDASTINLTDLLPANVTFRNSAYDGTTTLPVGLAAGSSGVTLAAGGLSYSNTAGSSWSYTPAAGYDAQVNGVKIVPSGEMAANSAFTLSFYARIK